jgi:predicted SAM-dependent methyltransferase
MREFVKRQLPRGLIFALKQLRNELSVMARHRRSVKKVPRYAANGPLRLNLASGNRPKSARWVNVDLFAAHADLRLDLREPLPFADNSVSYIHCEHFFEHLEYPNVWDAMGTQLEPPGLPSEALSFLRECRRVLAPGGTLDIGVPDAGRELTQYPTRHEGGFPMNDHWWGPKWADTPMHRINYLFRQGREHKYAYDEETLIPLIAGMGFADVRRRPFDPAMDAPDHDIGSLYVVATKPAAGGRSTFAPIGR